MVENSLPIWHNYFYKGCSFDKKSRGKGNVMRRLNGKRYILTGIGMIVFFAVTMAAKENVISEQTQFFLFLIAYLAVGFHVFCSFCDGLLNKNLRMVHLVLLLSGAGAVGIGRYSEGILMIFLFEMEQMFVELFGERTGAKEPVADVGCGGRRPEPEKSVIRSAKACASLVYVCAVLLMIVPPLTFSFGNWERWIFLGLVFQALSCPVSFCAAVPVAMSSGMDALLRRGIRVRDKKGLYYLAKANVFVFGGQDLLTETSEPEHPVREGVRELFAALKERWQTVFVMMSPDAEAETSKTAEELEMDHVYAELTPQEQSEQLEDFLFLQDDVGKVAFVGGEEEDFSLFSSADVSVCVGEGEADVAILDGQLPKLLDAVAIARKTLRIVGQNIRFAVVIKGVALVLAACGVFGMWQVMLAETAVTFITLLNAVWIKKYTA